MTEIAQMTDAQHIAEVASELELKADSYSPEGYSNRRCMAVHIAAFSDIGRVMFALGARNQDDDVNMTVEVFDWRYRTLGKGWIMFWPNIEPITEEDTDGCPPCPECKSHDTECRGPTMVSNIETYYKACNNCGHTWDPE